MRVGRALELWMPSGFCERIALTYDWLVEIVEKWSLDRRSGKVGKLC